MKISALQNREPFREIFCETLTLFLLDIYDENYTVEWHENWQKKVKINEQNWLCNPNINSIFIRNVEPRVFSSINGEYENNPIRPWRSMAQRAYLRLSQFRWTSAVFASHRIRICPPIKGARNKLIIGGNTKIRIIDIDQKKVYVILKNGFNRDYLEKELYVRRNFSFIDIPQIMEVGEKTLWYSEEYITGISPNRLEYELGQDVLAKAIEGVHKMLVSTIIEQTVSSYALKLESRIKSGLRKIYGSEFKERLKTESLLTRLLNELKMYANTLIVTSYCHGDFHQGNILYDGEKNWVLDWEHSGQKQIGYDLFVLLIDTRISEGFSKRFRSLALNTFDVSKHAIINSWPHLNWENLGERRRSLLLFILEEIDFHVSGSMNHLFYDRASLIQTYLCEWEESFVLLCDKD